MSGPEWEVVPDTTYHCRFGAAQVKVRRLDDPLGDGASETWGTWGISLVSLSPSPFSTPEVKINGQTWPSAEHALAAAEVYCRGFAQLRDAILGADKAFEALDLPGAVPAARPAFPPGGQIVH